MIALIVRFNFLKKIPLALDFSAFFDTPLIILELSILFFRTAALIYGGVFFYIWTNT